MTANFLPLRVNLLRIAIKRHLYDDSVDAEVGVERVDPLHELALRHRPGDADVVDGDADLVARLPLHVDVHVRVAPVPHLHDGQSGTGTLMKERICNFTMIQT